MIFFLFWVKLQTCMNLFVIYVYNLFVIYVYDLFPNNLVTTGPIYVDIVSRILRLYPITLALV